MPKRKKRAKGTPAQIAAGKKGAAIREAKKKAAATGQIIILDEHSVSVDPTGAVLSHLPEEDDPDFAEVDLPYPAAVQGSGRHLEPIDPPPPSPPPLKSKLDAIKSLCEAGWTEDAAFRMVADDSGAVHIPAGTVLEHGAALDQAAVELERTEQQTRYQEKMTDYEPPVLEQDFTVTLKMKFADYVRKWAAMETVRRRREVTESDAIQMMVRRFWQSDAERALLDQLQGGGATAGPAGQFNPTTGTYG